MWRFNSLLIAGLFSLTAYATHSGQDPFEINIGITGSWYTPEFPGQGFLIDVTSSRGEIFVAWFTYQATDDPTPATTLIADEQRWYVAQGSYQGHTGVLPMFSTSGGRFNTGIPISLNAIGTLTINFTNCTEGVVEVLFDSAEESVQFPIQRLTPDINCVRQSPAR